MVLEKTPESPLDSKAIKPVYLEGNHQPWILIGRTDGEAEASVFWSSDAKSLLIRKDLDAGKDWGQKNRVSEDEMSGWHHGCNGYELRQTLGDGEGQGGLVHCSPWGCKKWDRLGDWTMKTKHWGSDGDRIGAGCVYNSITALLCNFLQINLCHCYLC